MPTIQRQHCDAVRQIGLAVILCGFAFCGALASDSSSPDSPIHQVDGTTRRIDISDAEVVLLKYPDWLTTVKSSDPAIIQVTAIRPNCLRVQCVGQGTATLHAVDRKDQQYVLEVIVPASANVR